MINDTIFFLEIGIGFLAGAIIGILIKRDIDKLKLSQNQRKTK